MRVIDILLNDKKFESEFDKEIERILSQRKSEKEIYSEITNIFFQLLKLFHINDFNSFRFYDYEDFRKVVIDGKEYDLEKSKKMKNSLYTIDCLIADLDEDNFELILKKIEEKINVEMKNEKNLKL